MRQEAIGPYFGDSVCRAARLVVEVDGATHSTDDELTHDARRANYIEGAGYRIVRVTKADVYEQLDGVLELILSELEKATSA